MEAKYKTFLDKVVTLMDVNIFINGLIVLFILGVGLVGYMFVMAKQSRVKNIHITLPDLPVAFHEFSIYFLSDIHRRRLSTAMLAQVTNPDLIIIGGDLTEKGVPIERVSDNLRKLSLLKCPVLFVWGNHDLQVDPYKLRELLGRFSIQILTNDLYTITKDGEQLDLIGVHDATNALDVLEIPLLGAKAPNRLLISHNPQVTNKIKAHHRIPLVISGHTHGGQVRFFGWGIRELGGVKQLDDTTLILSNGYGTTRYPLRLGAAPDTLWIHLLAKV